VKYIKKKKARKKHGREFAKLSCMHMKEERFCQSYYCNIYL